MPRPVVARRVTPVRIATINVPFKVGRVNWERCIVEAMGRADIVVLNEILTRAQKKTVRAMIRRHGWRQRGLWVGPNPVIWNANVWRPTAANHVRLHARLNLWRLWPGFNAARYATIVALRHRHNPTNVTVIGTHLAPRGKKVTAAARRRARVKSQKVLNRRLANQRRLKRTAFVAGDLNMNPPMKLNGVKWLTSGGVDHIGIAVPAHVTTTITRPAARFKAPTDHRHGVAATVRLERKNR